MSYSDWADVESAAAELARNHREFESFAWFERPDDDENWAIVYTAHRDSDILDRCNAVDIGEALEPFTDGDDPDVRPESHSHWAVGYVDGFAIRVFRDGAITDAFRTYCELRERMDDYPILNESRLSEMETDEAMDSWNDWARSDFVRELVRECPLLPDDEREPIGDREWDDFETDEIDALWYGYVVDRIGWEYQFESSGCYFNIADGVRIVADYIAEFGRIPGSPPFHFCEGQRELF